MNVWQIETESDTYHNLVPRNPDRAFDLFSRFDGTEWTGEWTPPAVELEPCKKAGDFPALCTHVPVFSRRALDALEGLIAPCVQVFPLEYEDGRFYAVNVLAVPDSLDPDRSQVERFPESGRIREILRYVFREDRIRSRPIFKIPQEPLGQPFVLDSFKQLVERHRLRGLEFIPAT